MDFYRDNPMVKNILQLEQLPSVPTASRLLGQNTVEFEVIDLTPLAS